MLICNENKLMPIFGKTDQEFKNLLLPEKYVNIKPKIIYFILMLSIIIILLGIIFVVTWMIIDDFNKASIKHFVKLDGRDINKQIQQINNIFNICRIILMVILNIMPVVILVLGIMTFWNNLDFFKTCARITISVIVLMSLLIFWCSIILIVCDQRKNIKLYSIFFVILLLLGISMIGINHSCDFNKSLRVLLLDVIKKDESYLSVLQQLLNDYIQYCEVNNKKISLKCWSVNIDKKDEKTNKNVVSYCYWECPFISYLINGNNVNTYDKKVKTVIKYLINAYNGLPKK